MFYGQNRRLGWIVTGLSVTLVSLAIVFAADAQASARGHDLAPVTQFDTQAVNQIFTDDVVVGPEQSYEGDVVVYDGDVTVQDGGVIPGNLVVYSGSIEIDEGGLVQGDVTSFSGDIQVDGTVGGNVTSWSGDIELASSASVGGDVSVVSGDIQRGAGADVGGSVVKGPSLQLPAPPGNGLPFWVLPGSGTGVSLALQQPSLLERIGSLLLRLIVAGIFALLVALAAGVLTSVRPQYVDAVRITVLTQTPLSFAIGLLVNLVLFFLAGILTLTLCLAPIALAPMLVLLGLNLVSWTVLSQMVGERLTGALKVSWQPAVTVAAGALVTAGLVAALWAFGGCFRFLAGVAVLLASSAGVGAVILPWLKLNQASSEPQPLGAAPVVDESASLATSPAPAAPPAMSEPVSQPPAQLEPATESSAQTAEDDFTRLTGVGPVLDSRLRAAGIHTFAQLAALTPDELAAILGWTPDRVERANLIGQATELATA